MHLKKYYENFNKIINILKNAKAGLIVRQSDLTFDGRHFTIIVSIPDDDEFNANFFNQTNCWVERKAILKIQVFDEKNKKFTSYFGKYVGEIVCGSKNDTTNYLECLSIPNDTFIFKKTMQDYIENFDFKFKRNFCSSSNYGHSNYHTSNSNVTKYPLAIIAVGYRSKANEEKIKKFCPEIWPYLEDNKHLSIRFSLETDQSKSIEQLLQSAVKRGLF